MRQDSILLCLLYHDQSPVSYTVINPRHWPCELQSPTAANKDLTESHESNRIMMACKRQLLYISHLLISNPLQFKTFTAHPLPPHLPQSDHQHYLSPTAEAETAVLCSHTYPAARTAWDTHTHKTHPFLLSIFCSVSWPIHRKLCQFSVGATTMPSAAEKQPVTEQSCNCGLEPGCIFGLGSLWCACVSLQTAAQTWDHSVSKNKCVWLGGMTVYTMRQYKHPMYYNAMWNFIGFIDRNITWYT